MAVLHHVLSYRRQRHARRSDVLLGHHNGPIAAHFRPRRHRLPVAAYREIRDQRYATWYAVTGASVAD